MCAVKRFVIVMVVLALAGALVPGAADAASATARPGGRGGTWDFYLPISYAESVEIAGQGGSKVDINSDYGFGFGFGYNINDNFQMNGLFTWNSRSYQAIATDGLGGTRRYNNYMDTTTLAIGGLFYLHNGPIAPFVSAGIGITNVDTNIPSGPSTGSCWWDPWWGYVCSSYVPTKTENDMSYSAGAGVRFDVNRQFSLQGSFNRAWIDISRATNSPEFDTWRLDMIFRM